METTFLNQERYNLHTFSNSSNLAFAKHDCIMNTLELTFQNGSQYVYSGVTDDIFQALITSTSAGNYFSKIIRKFKCEKIK